MKKVISVFVSLVLLISLTVVLGSVALAAPDSIAIVIQVPDDWENPGFWAWGSEGNVFDAWPGEELEPLPGNPGWYYIHVPGWADGGLVNANNGSIQTSDFELTGEVLWVTVNGADEDFTVTFDAQTTGDIPVYVPKYTIFARVPADWNNPGLWAWGSEGNVFDAWPGEAMAEGDDWYSIKIPKWGSNIIVNANDGSVQTEDIVDMPGDTMWIIVEDSGRANVSFTNPDFAAFPMIKVRASVPADWDDIRLWAWGSQGDMFSGWPGGELTLVGDWYEIEVEGWADNFIINGHGGSVQTGDMTGVDTGVDVWFVVTDSSTYEYYYEEPDVVAAPDPTPTPTPDPTPDSSSDSSPQEQKSDTLLWVVLGVAGGAVVVAAVVVIVVVVIKKNKGK